MRNRAVRHPGRAKIFTRVDPLTGTSTLFGTSCWARTCRLAGGLRSCTDGPPVSTERSPDGRVVRARDQVANALAVARGGRSASAERMLREALGVLERRGQYAGAARAAATLSLVLQERGQTSKANDTLRQARALYEVARDVGVPGPGAGRLRGGAGTLAPIGRHHSWLDRPCRREHGVDASVGGRRPWLAPVFRSVRRDRCPASVRGCRPDCRHGPLRSTAVAPCGGRWRQLAPRSGLMMMR